MATIVALLSVSDGLTQTAAGLRAPRRLGPRRLPVGRVRPDRVGAADSLVARLERNPDVAAATPLLLIVGKVQGDAAAFVFGADPNGFFSRRLVFESRRRAPGRGAIAVGDGLAADAAPRVPGPSSSSTGAGSRSPASTTRGSRYEDAGGGAAARGRAGAGAASQGEATSIAVELAPGASAAAAQALDHAPVPRHTIVIAHAGGGGAGRRQQRR